MMTKKYMSRYLKCQRRHQPVVSPNANKPMKNMKKDKNKNINNDKQNLYQMIVSKMYFK